MPAFTARIERPPFYRGGSASKKDGWLLPHSPSDRARVSFHLLAGQPDCPLLRASNEASGFSLPL